MSGNLDLTWEYRIAPMSGYIISFFLVRSCLTRQAQLQALYMRKS